MIRNQVFQSKIRWILLKNQAIKTAISKMNVNKNTRNKEITLFKAYGNEGVFGRNDIAKVTETSYSSAVELIVKLKESIIIITSNTYQVFGLCR